LSDAAAAAATTTTKIISLLYLRRGMPGYDTAKTAIQIFTMGRDLNFHITLLVDCFETPVSAGDRTLQFEVNEKMFMYCELKIIHMKRFWPT
jgi:hypothetical protein